MPELIVQSCSKSKKKVSQPLSAFSLYSGYYYSIIKKAMEEGEYRDELDICIISAKYGLLEKEEEIEPYDRRMDKERAEELRPEIAPQLRKKINSHDYDRVILNLGQEYRHAVRGFESGIDTEVLELEGGLGERGHELKKIIRNDLRSQKA